MISIVLAYYNRQNQLTKTLDSFRQYDAKDFNVIIVDNASDMDIILATLPYDVKVVKLTDKSWKHCSTTFNTGFLEALKKGADIIIMQGAECSHAGDILTYAKRVTDETYITFGCYATAQGEDMEAVVRIDRPCTMDGQRSWYNHPEIRPVAYNFCSAITAKNLIKLNGFDERFKDGMGYEDNYFLHQIAVLGLRIEITADPIVYHQYHEVAGDRSNASWQRNYDLFNELSQGNEFKAKHILTPDLDASK